MPDRPAGWRAPSRSTSCRTPGETRRGGAGRQVENLRAILDLVKRTYNVDENRVVLSGVSDGGTGAYYIAMRDTTPFASFLPLNGFIMVLRNETADADGDLFPNNLLNKPLFIVNGGRDPLYPTSAGRSVCRALEERRRRSRIPAAAERRRTTRRGGRRSRSRSSSSWPSIRGVPLPDALTWESGPPSIPSRAHWLVIDRLAAGRPDDPALPDLNRDADALRSPTSGSAAAARASIAWSRDPTRSRSASGAAMSSSRSTISRVAPGIDVAELLRGFPPGRPLLLTVDARRRVGAADGQVRADGAAGRSRRDVSAAARIRAASIWFGPETGSRRRRRGVAAFTLLLSPDQFDLNRPVTVVVNGRTVFDGIVQRDVRTLLKWAARDNDRTMLFAAELPVDVPAARLRAALTSALRCRRRSSCRRAS